MASCYKNNGQLTGVGYCWTLAWIVASNSRIAEFSCTPLPRRVVAPWRFIWTSADLANLQRYCASKEVPLPACRGPEQEIAGVKLTPCSATSHSQEHTFADVSNWFCVRVLLFTDLVACNWEPTQLKACVEVSHHIIVQRVSARGLAMLLVSILRKR